MTTKPWDAQLAYWLVRPLKDSWVNPNHLTTVRLLTGLAAAVALAVGNTIWVNIGAWLFALSNFLDHTDGELARLSGKSSKWGHQYDLVSDAIIHILLFVCIGYGLREGKFGWWALVMGIVSGVSVACIFHLRNQMEQRLGKDASRQPNFAGFDIEDVLYLFPIVPLLNGLEPLLMAATIGAPTFAIWVIWQFLALPQSESN
ncbi:MAG: CDP-alcohol phosphatidyltransferase family protein [Nostoc sp. EfeVER01]|uniref:CDP-alcohol phosphatidyltransferase family protein n=1 Tax=unclassified Nostoc TaxID=2593658 RepID=UPI002AD3E797|nr:MULTISPECIES: CDP-alcohol phosphatidyltransferase family protein [unclassified Nostoc]MDZ7945436.1 CDP-alcohol phosphatidyltransferase family protein [Nostoc sp. EfeVER01]MDZ7994009.1 CDP-alcohol phosphatidyltransferase family protein [Nostoc sp. EspVER01]